MDHEQVHATHAVERYLLDELSGSEREEFEDHFFTCPECAEAVRSGTLLAVNARSVFEDEARSAAAAEDSAHPPVAGRMVEMPIRPSPRQMWFQRAIGAIAATILLGTAAVYQNAPPSGTHVPATVAVNRSVQHWKITADTRGEAASNVIKLAPGVPNELDLEIPALHPLPAYRVEIRNQSGAVFTEASVPAHNGIIYVPFPQNLGPGSYEVLVGTPVSFHYHLQLTQ